MHFDRMFAGLGKACISPAWVHGVRRCTWWVLSKGYCRNRVGPSFALPQRREQACTPESDSRGGGSGTSSSLLSLRAASSLASSSDDDASTSSRRLRPALGAGFRPPRTAPPLPRFLPAPFFRPASCVAHQHRRRVRRRVSAAGLPFKAQQHAATSGSALCTLIELCSTKNSQQINMSHGRQSVVARQMNVLFHCFWTKERRVP